MSKEVGITKVGLSTIFPVVVYLLIIAMFANSTEDNIMLVLLGMIPSMFNLIILIAFDPTQRENRLIVWLAPLVLATAFFVVWASEIIPVISGMEGPSLAFINMILGYFLTLFFIIPEYIPRITINRTIKSSGDFIDLGSEDDDIRDIQSAGIAPLKGPTPLETNQGSNQCDNEQDNKNIQKLKNTLEYYDRQAQKDKAELQRLKKAVKRVKQDSQGPQTYIVRENIARYEGVQWRESHDLKQLRDMIKEHNSGYNFQKSQIKSLLDVVDKYQKQSKYDREEAQKLKYELIEKIAELKITKTNVRATLRSIEDKLKAINGVIGRVYRDSKGGSKHIRELIRIPREMYNDFTELVKHKDDIESKEKLVSLIHEILVKLRQLEQRERDVFKVKKGRVILDRYPDDTILELLERNDDDPVTEYHAEAKEICNKVLKYIREN